MHKEHTNIHNAAVSNFKTMKTAEIKVNATINSNTKRKSFLIFLFTNIFIVHPNQQYSIYTPYAEQSLFFEALPDYLRFCTQSAYIYGKSIIIYIVSLQSHSLLKICSGERTISGFSINMHNNLYSLAVKSSCSPFL